MVDSARKSGHAAAALGPRHLSPDRPLDALLPALAAPAAPTSAVHPRVLELTTEAGLEWVGMVWESPGNASDLHREVQALVEAALLAELSRTPTAIRATGDRHFSAIRLLVFADLGWDAEPALRAFGFQRDEGAIDSGIDKAVRAEADRSGRVLSREAHASWRAEIRHPPEELATPLNQLQLMLASQLGDERWGQRPGRPSHLFASGVTEVFREQILPDMRGLQTLQRLLVQNEPGVVRWMPPLVFQALCDFLPVVASREFDASVSWAEAESLGEGYAHPPLVRVGGEGEEIHIPLGHHVLRWWMMPLMPGEEVPTLGAWVSDQFGPTLADPTHA